MKGIKKRVQALLVAPWSSETQVPSAIRFHHPVDGCHSQGHLLVQDVCWLSCPHVSCAECWREGGRKDNQIFSKRVSAFFSSLLGTFISFPTYVSSRILPHVMPGYKGDSKVLLTNYQLKCGFS